MADSPSAMMKRKELEEVYEEFSDFSLYSPARKIRRLDAELAMIMEQEEPTVPWVFKHQVPEDHLTTEQIVSPLTETVTPIPSKEERALVLYKPVKNKPLLQSSNSSNFSITINSELIPGLKNHIFWPGQPDSTQSVKDESALGDGRSNQCLAVVPWLPSQLSATSKSEASSMETEENEAAIMEIEDENKNTIFRETDAMEVGEDLQQWQQQHCMTSQLPQNTTTPIMWSW